MDIQERVKAARLVLEQKWDLYGDCNSCGFHACLYEHDVEDSDIRDALINNRGVLELTCKNTSLGNDRFDHRGVTIHLID